MFAFTCILCHRRYRWSSVRNLKADLTLAANTLLMAKFCDVPISVKSKGMSQTGCNFDSRQTGNSPPPCKTARNILSFGASLSAAYLVLKDIRRRRERKGCSVRMKNNFKT